MALWTLTSVLAVAMALRVAFLAFHLRDLEGLWRDYERRGMRWQLARVLDYVTLGVFAVSAVWTLRGLDTQDPRWAGKVFVAWLGFLLLARLAVHRFPRTNVPGALSEAKLNLAVHVLLSVLGALAATAVTWFYSRWKG